MKSYGWHVACIWGLLIARFELGLISWVQGRGGKKFIHLLTAFTNLLWNYTSALFLILCNVDVCFCCWKFIRKLTDNLTSAVLHFSWIAQGVSLTFCTFRLVFSPSPSSLACEVGSARCAVTMLGEEPSSSQTQVNLALLFNSSSWPLY